jgi:hypothetical protein
VVGGSEAVTGLDKLRTRVVAKVDFLNFGKYEISLKVNVQSRNFAKKILRKLARCDEIS